MDKGKEEKLRPEKNKPQTKVKGSLVFTWNYDDNIESEETEFEQKILRVVKFVLDERQDKTKAINEKNDDGETPIHLAAQIGKTLLVESLLKAGADIYIANNRGLTARDDDKTG